jgi:hypothetical protein
MVVFVAVVFGEMALPSSQLLSIGTVGVEMKRRFLA